MNTSRDIEKLFEHFGGNAGDYQEIGKENEARSARTRWPLLATLDFTQPPIPEVAQRRDVQLPAARGARGEIAADASPAPTPINRGKPPLFARSHRRTIPPVGNVTLPAAVPGASRFGDAGEAEAHAEAAPIQPPATIASAAPAVPNALSAHPAHTPLRTALNPTPPAAAAFAAPKPAAIPARPAAAAPAAASPSILGKLFAPPAPEAAPQQAVPGAAKSLVSVFDRLRGSLANEATTRNDSPAAPRAWATSRTPRS
jgi:hypothetical protein